jgi:mannose-1-phosphate guanylyltransferase
VIEKAVLLAAGPGTRLGTLTQKTPKCLLPVDGKPILGWWLETLARLGVTEALVNTHHLAAQVEAFASRWQCPPKLSLSREKTLLGSAGTLAANKDFIGSGPFWIVYADTLVRADLKALAGLHEKRGATLTLGLFRAPDPKSCGVVTVDRTGKAVSFEEKPKAPKSDLAFAGVAVAEASLLERIPPGFADLGRDVFARSLAGVYGLELDGAVVDIGTPQSYAKVRGKE